MSSPVASSSAALPLSVRHRRMHRARAAAYLATLDSSCSVEELLTLDWSALERVPHWCFMPQAQQRQLQQLCGALFLAPMVQGWISGRQLQSLRELLGDTVFQSVLTYQPLAQDSARDPAVTRIDENQIPDLAQMLDEAGASVLLGAVQHPVIARVLQSGFPASGKDPLPAPIAQRVYHDALQVFDRLNAQSAVADASALQEQPA